MTSKSSTQLLPGKSLEYGVCVTLFAASLPQQVGACPHGDPEGHCRREHDAKERGQVSGKFCCGTIFTVSLRLSCINLEYEQ